MTAPLFKNLCIIGPGLIGSSVLRRAMLDRSIATHLTVTDINPDVRTRVRTLAIADTVADTTAEAVANADCVMLCVPVGAIAGVARTVLPHLKPGAILTDVGSVKMSVLAELDAFLPPDIPYIPTHPMAGTEYSGPDAGFPSLFETRWCLVTPRPNTPDATLSKITTLWEKLGARVRVMDATHHDKVCAIVSHLPHLLAFTICNTADTLADETRSEVLDFAASGFRDFTRIAASDPTMWRDIFLHNREALLDMLDRFTNDAQTMATAIRNGDDATIVTTIARGREIRRSLIENQQA